MTKNRCSWANDNELFVQYHDDEWGVPVHDDTLLFEMLNLEGAQAGLSWLTILKKRNGYRAAFDNFDFNKIAKYTDVKQLRLLENERIVRHRLKINAVIENAKAVIAIRKEFGSFDRYIWQFVGGKTLVKATRNHPGPECAAMSKDLKKRGFRFVGITTCYSFMQAVGMVDDHSPDCFRAKKRRT